MGLAVKAILEPVKLFAIALVLTVQGSGGSNISPSPAIFPGIPPIIEGIPHPVHQGTPLRSNAPSSDMQPRVPNLHPLPASLPPKSALVPQSVAGFAPSYSMSSPVVTPRYNPAPPPLVFQGHAPYLAPSIQDISPSYNVAPPPSTVSVLPPDSYQRKTPVGKTAIPLPSFPVLSPSSNSPQNSPIINPGAPKMSPTVSVLPPDGYQRKKPVGKTAVPLPSLPVLSPSSNSPQNSPVINPGAPKMSPTVSVLPPDSYQRKTPVGKTAGPLPSLPVLSPSSNSPQNSPVINPGAPKMSPTVSVLPPDGYQRKKPVGKTAVPLPSLPVLSPSSNSPQNLPVINPGAPKMSPTVSVLPPDSYQRKTPVGKTVGPLPSLPVLSPSSNSPQNSSVTHSVAPKMSPHSSHPRNKSLNGASVPRPSTPEVFPSGKLAPNEQAGQPNVPAISPSISPGPPVSSIKEIPSNSPALHPIMPGEPPSTLLAPDVSHAPTTPSIDRKQNEIPVAGPSDGPHKLSPSVNHFPTEGPGVSQAPTTPSIDWKQNGIPVAAPTNETHKALTPVNHLPTEGPEVSHASTPPPGINWRKDGVPVAAPPPDETSKPLPPVHHSPSKVHKAAKRPSVALVPSQPLAPSGRHHSPSFSPSVSPHEQNQSRNITNSPAPVPSHLMHPPIKENQAPASPPSFLPTSRHVHYAPQSPGPGPSASTQHQHFPKPETNVLPAPSPSPVTASGWTEMPVLSPKHPSLGSKGPKTPFLPPVQKLPPPPPNEDCSATFCMDPYTNTPPGSPCGCVLPMQVGLRLGVALYTFFPLVSELAQEIAAGVFMKQSQVRIMGANAASRQPEKTTVLIDLVPLGERFDNTTAFLIYQRFWHKEVVIKFSLFGDYDVLYVRYPGLPPSPPSASSSIGIADNGPYSGNDNNARTIKPLGVDVQKRHHKDRLGGGMIAIITLSACVALVLCFAVAWFFLFRHRDHIGQPVPGLQPLPPSIAKPSGTGSMIGSGLSSTSLSFGSSIAPYTGSARTLSTGDLERATNNFDASRILGEGGFGCVYSGILEDGTKVAVKVLKRDDQQGGREFLAEVEMLSRLHHRNLVKLIGICTEEHARSLVYELIANGSVDSHLHGVDKESSPLNWDSRIKIALGAARGLAYLHEDSSPRVIHRDFKSSNILLEHDFTPKVSDFGLARTALDEENRHISTRVMGTFGYVAPEYAMTGHLLVKSDVYSYGVVLLELLTGRKPVDMSRPPGQENLVAWARPLLTSKECLEIIIDPSLGPDVRFDSVAKVAAIASMCVQPEVSHRPFMGEVVQALKLVCNECDEAKEVASRSSSGDLSADMDTAICTGSGNLPEPSQNQSLSPNYGSEPDIESGVSMSEFFDASVINGRQTSGSFRRYPSSGPLTTGKGRWFWQRMRSMSGESVSEHKAIFRIRPSSH